MRFTDFRWCRLSMLTLVYVLIPAVGYAETPSTDAALRHAWTEVQTRQNREMRESWWRQLRADELEAYMRAGVDVNCADQRDWTPLHSAARYSADTQVLSILLRSGAIVDARNRSGDTPLHWAAAENPDIAVVNALLDAGANVNAVDRFGWLPIHTAAESSANPAIIRALMKAGSKRGRRAYFLLFSPGFLLKHNRNMSDADKELARRYLDAN